MGEIAHEHLATTTDLSYVDPLTDAELEARIREITASFGVREWLLYMVSKSPRAVFKPGFYSEPTEQWGPANALSELEIEFPDLRDLIRGKRVLDYGCGDGFQSIALARAGAGQVLGVDIAQARLAHARRMAEEGGPGANVSFATRPEGEFDVAISLNSFEHLSEPEESLDDLARAIARDGKILITFGSPWLSPYGAHMNFFTHLPWVNTLFPEETVFRVRRLYRSDQCRSYLEGMNKMTVGRFEKIIECSALKRTRSVYRAVRNLPVLSKLPLVRELFINRVTCVLQKS